MWHSSPAVALAGSQLQGGQGGARGASEGAGGRRRAARAGLDTRREERVQHGASSHKKQADRRCCLHHTPSQSQHSQGSHSTGKAAKARQARQVVCHPT